SRERSPPSDVQVTVMKNCPRNPTRSRVTLSPPSKVRQGELELQRPALMRAFKSLNSGAGGLKRSGPDSAPPSSRNKVVAFAGTIPKAPNPMLRLRRAARGPPHDETVFKRETIFSSFARNLFFAVNGTCHRSRHIHRGQPTSTAAQRGIIAGQQCTL